MPMPKGHKAMHGHATVTERGGLGYREIAQVMTTNGDGMKHSAARNYFLSGMRKFADEFCFLYGVKHKDTDRVARDPRFQESVADLISDEIEL